MPSHDRLKEEIIAELKTNPESGLSPTKVAALQRIHGPNRLHEKKKKSLLTRFLDQFKEPGL